MTVEDDYPGMRNPYHLADIEDLTTSQQAKNWDKLTNKEKEEELINSLKNKYKNSQDKFDVSVIKGKLFDPKGKEGNSSPLYPWVDRWWD